MQVYDLDKTQQWLDRTLAINKQPPVRGGVKTDHRTRRQTLAGVMIVGIVLLALALWPRAAVKVKAETPLSRVKVPAADPAGPEALTIAAAQSPIPRETPNQRRRTTRRTKWVVPTRSIDQKWALSNRDRTENQTTVAPPAPIWLDGK